MRTVDWLAGATMHIPPWEAFLRLAAAVLAGALGAACGAGDYTLAVFGTIFALIVLSVLGYLERAAHKRVQDDSGGK